MFKNQIIIQGNKSITRFSEKAYPSKQQMTFYYYYFFFFWRTNTLIYRNSFLKSRFQIFKSNRPRKQLSIPQFLGGGGKPCGIDQIKTYFLLFLRDEYTETGAPYKVKASNPIFQESNKSKA